MAVRIPESGLQGAALREAATSEFRQIIELVRAALAKKVYSESPERAYVHIEAIYPDRAICERDGRYWAYPYTLNDDNTVAIGEPLEVIEQYVPVTLRESRCFIEAAENGRWLIRVIRAGLSLNKNFYPDAVLREAAPLFEGARVFAKSDDEHIKGGGKDVRNLLGRLVEAKFSAGAMPDCGELRAKLELIEPEGEVAVKLREAHSRGMGDLFGFSIDAEGSAKAQLHEGQRVKVAQKINKVNSVDLIVEPGAGGQLIRLVESVHPEEPDMALRERMIEAVKAAHNGQLPANLNTNDDAALETAYREAVASNKPTTTQAGSAAGAPAAADLGAIEERIRMVEARASARVAISTSNLPQPAKDKLLNDFAARERFVEADVTAAINAEREYLARFTESGKPVLHFGEVRVEDRAEKLAGMLDAFFDPAHKDHRATQSFKECYIEITGDRRVSGRLGDCNPTRLREAIGAEFAEFRESLTTASWANVLGSSITRRMIADYQQTGRYDVWRRLGNVVPVGDFRIQERTRFGGYGDLPAVAQGDPYASLTSPTDEKATYAVTKRGGTEDVTLEMIRNDDVGSIRQIPVKMSRAAKRTLSKFVLDFLATNPTIYDSVALFHATHGNLGAAALSATTVAAGRLAVLKQTELSSSDRIGIPPVNLWVPFDLEEGAFELFRRTTNNDTDFVESLQMNVLPVWYWSDANNWFLSCDYNEVPTVEIGFLDGNEEPELFVQDSPTVGSLFSNDKITYKIRHIYGGNVLEYRGLYGAIVA
ncbi:hypothetical protein [Methylocaldum sp.]|uniref:phage major capsid protein n=1 Tax=Methylocaldum sp. TaxID=1969727 RepID=UPI002D3EEA01|nr:hypothetical protein [Methylocaldum sp.]HYE35500.1 hypothetical protein [Methylocaldum sp.]